MEIKFKCESVRTISKNVFDPKTKKRSQVDDGFSAQFTQVDTTGAEVIGASSVNRKTADAKQYVAGVTYDSI